MRIAAITQPLSAEFRKLENASRKAEKNQSSTRVFPKDSQEFSAAAQHLSDTKAQSEAISASLDAQPDVRPEKIAEVQEKIDRGYYDSKEFNDILADKLLSEIGIKPPAI